MHFKFSFLSLTTMYICMGFCAFILLCIQNGVQHIVSINYASHKNWEILNHYFLKYFLLFFYLLIDFWEREREDIFLFFYLFIHSLVAPCILICDLTGDWTHNLGLSGWCSNQLSYLAKAFKYFFCFIFFLHFFGISIIHI